MKYLKLDISPTERAIHPIDEFVAGHDAVSRESLLHVDSRADGTTVLLYRVVGDGDAFGDALDDQPSVHDHEVVDIVGEGYHAFIQADSTTRGNALLDIAHEYALIIDTPLEFTGDELRATLVGTHENLRGALGSIPDSLEFSVGDAGTYVPGSEDLLSPLTDRQLEVFETAIEEGYYDVPRRATHKDIADNLGCAPSTVDEHLRKAESRVVAGLVQ
ncbi:helix-turn-helix domain-containing protein [Natronomonas gomsonensis]|jgi:predicted DNA binding protein|uniref:helix-turn-helix domain-containing protein n=1 Tax=Natronomonas gomsonensis TaxID=1046043 RepID=UPI0020CA4F2F|nr:helix-turn-helix domain-containing protein [Natronomonas gomsonensis]MCY4732403.1 helix-turn-helix domain-containing protein [Natronomonas gomsonensis]